MRFSKAVGASVLAVLLVGATIAATGDGATAPRTGWKVTALMPDSTYTGFKSHSGALAESDPSLLGRSDSTRVNVLIKYDLDATASYTGGVAGLAPTSPVATGKSLDHNKAAVNAYDKHATKVAEGISGAVKAAVPSAKIEQTFTTAYGGVAAQLPANKVDDLLKVDGVAAVQKDSLEQPQDDNTGFIGATAVWPSLGGSSQAGSNVVVGVLDTGVWPEHPMLSPAGISAPDGGLRGCDAPAADGDVAHLGPAFTCNNKLIGAYAFTDTYLAVIGSDGDEFCNDGTGVCSPRDSDGHGTHTTTTAAGDCVSHATLYGVDRGPVCGIAPGAHVIIYRVCLEQGCFNSDSIAAINQAIDDGVDVINYSIGGGANPYADAVELTFLDAFNAGISVNASAGNSGPGAGTVEHGGPWVTTVGASTGPRFFQSTLHLTADGGANFDMPGVTLVNGLTTPTAVVLGQNIPGETAGCDNKLSAGSAASGKVVLCQRGPNRVLRGFNVYSGGAAGMILYNPIDQSLMSDSHWLPAIHVQGPPTALLAFVGSHSNVRAMWAQGVPTATTPDVMTDFSSRGPQADFIKPDVTAPGLQVLAGASPDPDSNSPVLGPPGNLYQAIAGTSMSSPHSAGVSALVKAAHPDWDPAEIKSALMTSAVTNVVNWDGSAATPFDDGAGSIRADRAVNPTLVFDESFDDYEASRDDALHRVDLNLPSVDATTMTGSLTTVRTATNVTGKDQDLDVSTVAPDGVQIIVSDQAPKGPGHDGTPAPLPKSDKTIHLKNGTTKIWITISAPGVANGQYFGRITLDPKKNGLSSVTMPVAFDRQQGTVTLTHTCTPTTIPATTGLSHCSASVTNLGSLPANTTLTVTNLDKGKGLDFTNVSAPASSIRKDDGVQWSGTLTPALAPTIDSISAGADPDIGGYFPLGSVGIPAISAGDDTIANFTVPAYRYGSETYTTLGVASNGLLLVGGGNSTTPFFQTFPDPNSPNNVIAPFWTDLNPAAAGLPASSGIRVATASDSVAGKRWIIVDWGGIPNFNGGPTHSFEVWIETATLSNGTPTADGERISLEYDTTGPGDPGVGGVGYGAENRDGTSGVNIMPAPANGSEYTIHTSPPTPGGTQTITYDASSRKAGTYRSIAGMTSDVTPGTTQVLQTITVTK